MGSTIEITAGVLHDIGYAYPSLGLHALDGAHFLRAEGFSPLVCDLVVFHSCSPIEAEVRGIPSGAYEPFLYPEDARRLHQVICWADMTTGPTGPTVSVEARLEEIQQRYGPEHLVSAFIDRARHSLVEAVQSVTSGSM